MNGMKPLLKSMLIGLCIVMVLPPPLYAGNVPGEAESNIHPSQLYNPREEYILGIGTILGGSAGGLGIQADYHLLPRFGIQLGVGSGYYFESLFISARHYFLESTISPYMSLGYAAWRGHSDVEKLVPHFSGAKKLGLIDEKESTIHLLPLAFGVQFVSKNGIAVFTEFTYILSLTTFSGVPYGALGFQWYF